MLDRIIMTSAEQKGALRNLLLRIAYDGTDYYGWQIQPQQPTIQGHLAAALEKVCEEEVEVCGSGRTDAGVHAGAQAANVRVSSPIPCPNLVKAVNRLLPESIRVLSARQAPDDFHARHHARSKAYHYRIFRGDICPPWLCRFVYPYPYPLEEAAIEEAAKHFQGTLDFRSFAAADGEEGSEEKSCVRTVFSSVLSRQGEELIYTIEGNGFLRHMVRNIVGTLIDVGRKRISPEKIPEILAVRSRSAAGPTAPARGLHLIAVSYPAGIDQSSPLDNNGYPVKIE